MNISKKTKTNDSPTTKMTTTNPKNPAFFPDYASFIAKINKYKEHESDLRTQDSRFCGISDSRLLSEILLDGQKLLKDRPVFIAFTETYHQKCHAVYKQASKSNKVGITDLKKTISEILFTEYQYVYCGCTTKQGHYCLNGAITSDRDYVCRVHKKQRKRQKKMTQ